MTSCNWLNSLFGANSEPFFNRLHVLWCGFSVFFLCVQSSRPSPKHPITNDQNHQQYFSNYLFNLIATSASCFNNFLFPHWNRAWNLKQLTNEFPDLWKLFLLCFMYVLDFRHITLIKILSIENLPRQKWKAAIKQTDMQRFALKNTVIWIFFSFSCHLKLEAHLKLDFILC